MTSARVVQLPVEVIRLNQAPGLRVVQLPVEVIRLNTSVRFELYQMAVEVLRPNVVEGSPSSGCRPVCFVCT